MPPWAITPKISYCPATMSPGCSCGGGIFLPEDSSVGSMSASVGSAGVIKGRRTMPSATRRSVRWVPRRSRKVSSARRRERCEESSWDFWTRCCSRWARILSRSARRLEIWSRSMEPSPSSSSSAKGSKATAEVPASSPGSSSAAKGSKATAAVPSSSSSAKGSKATAAVVGPSSKGASSSASGSCAELAALVGWRKARWVSRFSGSMYSSSSSLKFGLWLMA